VELYRSDRLDSEGPAELLPYLERLRELRVRVFGDVLDMTLSELTAPIDPVRNDDQPPPPHSKEAAS
jgi:hypothetical protein